MSETKEKLDLNKLEAKDGELKVTHVHQTLETPKVFYKKTVQIAGTITAPGNFVEKRFKGLSKEVVVSEDQHERERTNVQYSFSNGEIVLRMSENEEVFYEVSGKLQKNKDIEILKINTGSKLSVQDLSNHLRMKRFFFSDKDQHARLMQNLQTFKVEANKVIEAQNDNRGNARDLYEIKNTSNVDLSFDVTLPIFVGEPQKRFKVEILYAVRERAIEVWLESVEIEEALKADAQGIIEKELQRLPKEFVFIER